MIIKKARSKYSKYLVWYGINNFHLAGLELYMRNSWYSIV